MGVTPQVVDHRPGPGKRTLGIHHPGFGEERAEELRVFSRKGLAQRGHHPGTHHPAQGFYREEEPALGAGPLPIAGRRDASAGHNAVQVRMQGEVLAPGVQYGDHARTRTQVNAVPCKGVDHAPCRGKERVIDPLRCVQAQAVEFPGQGEHHVEVRHRQQLRLAGCHPVFPRQPLALGAVAVPATVVAHAQVGTARTLVQVTAQGCRAAVPDQAQRALLPVVELLAALNLFP